MATTLSYGYVQPANGDNGAIWFPALNTNITLLNGHTHDGVTSAPISGTSITAGTVSVPSGSWTSDGTGRFKQDVTVPTGFNMDSFTITVRISSSGYIINPTIEKLTTTTFRIYGPDNTLTYTAAFR